MDEKQPEEIWLPTAEELKIELAREEAKSGFRRGMLNVLVVLVVAAAITVLIATRLLVLIRIEGNSMSPTLDPNEIIFLRQTRKIETGDIVGFYYGGRILLKRAIGVAGDQIEIDEEGNVFVNDEMVEEPYLTEKHLGKCDIKFPYEVPEETIFVLGDNRAVSVDSRTRYIGCVTENQIVGKAVFRAWPLDHVGIMR